MSVARTGQSAPALPVFQFWHSPEIPDDVGSLVDTVASVNPDLCHRVFDAVGAENLIASHFTQREVEAFRACRLPAMQADYFRYCAVFAHGGIYLDSDIECRAPLRALLAGDETGRLFERVMLPNGQAPPYPLIVNGFFAFAGPGSPLVGLALELATEIVERRVVEDPWAATGPGLFTSLHLLHRCGSADSFLERAEGKLAPTARLVCELAADTTRVSSAFEGVTVSPLAEATAWVRHVTLPYKESRQHWVNHAGSIFR